ncbi:protein of unknown function [Flexibacter flexilis DSM 6793]|uniref:DUF4349 domain-containing protein n=1 Tax=Flexibacter flexilis DSM 6793 TaxID=927664 RepID=A0A1I1J272_9BACT|nr:DUF4349 domain-containing protein [Flexibacter flexilis]SFC42699.1 protein of unknown function [Flexibacter flexilis DSM 6793]
MKKIHFFAWITMLFLVTSCGQAHKSGAPALDEQRAESAASATDSASAVAANQPEASGIAGQEGIKGKPFILQSNTRAQVKNLRQTNTQIERLTHQLGGYLTVSNLTSNVLYQDETPVSADSLLVTKHFQSELNITIRVPVQHFDTIMASLDKLYFFIDSRNITADDASLDLLATQLSSKRLAKYSKRISSAVDKANQKDRTNVADITAAEESNLSAGQSQDQNQINALRLKNQIELATINLNLYQEQSIQRYLKANENNIKAYQPSFFSRVSDALGESIDSLLNFIIGFVTTWWVWVILGLIAWGIWRGFKRKKAE